MRSLCDEEYSTTICVNHRFSDPKTWPLAVDYTAEMLIHHWSRSRNSSDTNMQSCMSTESPVAVPIDVRGCSSFDKWEPSEKRVTSNFLSIFSNISCGYVFSTDLHDLEKWPLRTSKNRNSVINRNTFTPAIVMIIKVTTATMLMMILVIGIIMLYIYFTAQNPYFDDLTVHSWWSINYYI